LGTVLVAGADPDESALTLFAETYGPDVFVTTEYEELLEHRLDAVIIASPDYCHEEHAIAALRAGTAVYLETPMATTVEGCDRVLRAAMESGARLFVGHSLRYTGFVRKMKELIDGGAIGEVKAGWCRNFISHGGDTHFKDWHSERRNVGSLLVHGAVHDIDVLHWLCGGHTSLVSALGALSVYDQVSDRRSIAAKASAKSQKNGWPPLSQTGLSPVIDVEDLSSVNLRLNNGVLCSYSECQFAPDAWRNYTILGTEGRLENFGNCAGRATIRLWNRRADTFIPEGDEQFLVEGWGEGECEGDHAIVADFLAWLRGDAKPLVSPLDGRHSVAAAHMATESLRDNGMARWVSGPAQDIEAYYLKAQLPASCGQGQV
jgi:predicted dehydrogenase